MKKNLNVWAIEHDKKEMFEALEKVKKDSSGNMLYLNCEFRLMIENVVIKNRTFDSCFYSEESDIIIFFAKGVVSVEEIENYLKEKDFNYNTVVFLKASEDFEENIGEIDLIFASDKVVLENAINDSLKKKMDMCLYYPGEKVVLYLGYKSEENKFVDFDKRVCEGTIVFKDKIVLVNSQNNPKNLTNAQAKKMLEEKGIVVLERGNAKGR